MGPCNRQFRSSRCEAKDRWLGLFLCEIVHVRRERFDLVGLQRFFICGHFVFALGNDLSEVGLGLALHLAGVEVVHTQLLSDFTAAAIGGMASRAFSLVGRFGLPLGGRARRKQ